MVSGGSARSDEHVHVAKKKSSARSSASSKEGAKVPRKVHKAEREKLKRDHMNDLFLELGKVLEPTSQNSGKSCTLTDTVRTIQDLFDQVEALKKENATLLAESQYVAVEKSELKEENSAMEAQIHKLKAQIEERARWPPCPFPPPPPFAASTPPSFENNVVLPVSTTAAAQGAPAVGPVVVVPLQNGPKLYTEPTAGVPDESATNHRHLNVTKPHARYPSPSHTWSFNFLSEQPRVD